MLVMDSRLRGNDDKEKDFSLSVEMTWWINSWIPDQVRDDRKGAGMTEEGHEYGLYGIIGKQAGYSGLSE
ncbi:MAG TPA: hypothetical protein VEF33_07240 [Syntrophales bacterium]|nr:hypothetical protein [Syntrophales bacterium]